MGGLLPVGFRLIQAHISRRTGECGMKTLLLALLMAQGWNNDCATMVTLRGIGTAASHQVAPYVACLNARGGTAARLQAACAEARLAAVSYQGTISVKKKVDRAVRWLDHMVEERALCETRLGVTASR